MNSPLSTPVSVRVANKTIELIDLAILIGYAKNRADFAEKSIINQLKELGLFEQKIQNILKLIDNSE